MNNNPIGVFDSGIGGLSILKELLKILPNESYIYYADSINNPYGSKQSEELCEITGKIVEYLIERKCKIIVIACNTASTVCIKYLREKYKDIIFISTVPAIKIAYDHNSKNTLVLATPYTIKTKRLHELVTTYKHKNQTITLVPCHNLANTIEYHKDNIDTVIKNTLEPFQNNNYDTVVLGCTHYSMIKRKFKEYFKSSEIVDGNIGVAKETKRQLEINNLISDSSKGIVELYNSNPKYSENMKKILEDTE